MKAIRYLLIILLPALPALLPAQTEVSGSITANTTWAAGDYLLKGNVTVRSEAVLTIEAGARINLAGYTLQIGSSTAGALQATGATFSTTSTSEKKIFFADGGGGTINGCSFNQVFVEAASDAGISINLTNNTFVNIAYPVRADINRIPALSGNQSDQEKIGLSGNLTESRTLPQSNWYYQLLAGVTIRNSALLTISPGTTLDLGTTSLTIGSTTPGELYASGALFRAAGSTDRKIIFKEGGKGTITQSVLDNVTVQVESDADPNIWLTHNQFRNITYPVLANPARIPVCSFNTSPVERMGLGGTVTQSCTMVQTQWSIDLTASIIVKGGAVLTIPSGVMVDLRSYTIYGGNSTAGTIMANGAIFMGSGSTDRAITFMDGGRGEIRNCILINVYVNIESDAGAPVELTGNSFEEVLYPVRMAIYEGLEMEGNTSTAEWIGLRGTMTADRTLVPLQWDYVLADAVTINDGATLTIGEGVSILLNGRYLYVGSGASSTGTLMADGVRFHEVPGKSGWIYFKTGSDGELTGCEFESVRLYLASASPVIRESRIFHCKEAVYLTGTSSPILENNDFYNNVTAIDNRGTGTAEAGNNYWAHPTGPQHEGNPGGLGETVKGLVNYANFRTAPSQGSTLGVIEPARLTFPQAATGTRRDTTFVLRNDGDEDLLVAGITTTSSSLSVYESDRFWILPDSSRTIRFSFTLYQQGVTRDTIYLNGGSQGQPLLALPVEGRGEVEGLVVNFFHIDVDSFPVVRCHFTVSDQAGLPVRMLTKDDLELTEQGAPITDYDLILRTSNQPIKVALVMDRSGSMSGQRLRDAKAAAIDFVNLLGDQDQACLIGFADNATVHQPFTSDKQLLVNKINMLSPTGATAIFDAVNLAVDQVLTQSGVRAILALTDGEDNRSATTPDVITARANQNGINIYSIGLGNESEPLMSQLATETGGQYFFAPTSAELGFIYHAISGQIHNLYIARYIADEEGPYPRKVEITAVVYDQGGSDYRYYSMEDLTIHFLAWDGQPLRNPDFSRGAVNYFYYLIDQDQNELPAGFEFAYLMKYGNKQYPCGGAYMGNGILQFWIDLRTAASSGNYTISIPDAIGQTGGQIVMADKPAPFVVNVTRRVITQDIDLFAGGSLGAKGMAGAVGAGASVAAASVSVSGSAGMGINFERDQSGNQKVSRRLEVGVSSKLEAPSINTGIDLVEMGASVEITTKGTVGQAMYFPANFTDRNTLLKAKSAYLLETMAIGGLAVSPLFGVVLKAVQMALVAVNPDVNRVYDSFNHSWNAGLGTEGRIGVGFKLAPGKSSGLPALTFAEAGASIGLEATFEHLIQSGGLNFGLGLATGFDFKLLNLNFGSYDLGSLFKSDMGAKMTLDADFTTADGFKAFNMGMQVYGTGDVLYYEEFTGTNYGIRVPRAVISRALNTPGNLVHSVGQLFDGQGIQPNLMIGPATLTNGIGDIFGFNEEEMTVLDDHITMDITEQAGRGLNADIKVGLDVALGLGAGLEFGVSFAYMDMITGPVDQYTFTRGQILPLASFSGVTRQESLFSITDEMWGLFDGVIRLVKDGISNLVALGEWLFDAGSSLAIDAYDNTVGLAGDVVNGGKVVIRKFDPRNWGVINRPFLEAEVVRLYRSDRISHPLPGRLKSGPEGESVLYVVSDSYNISLFNTSGELNEEFDPLHLTLSIAYDRLQDLGFGDEEKGMARLYRYVPETIGWELIGADAHPHADSVAADITLSGTYVVGIEIFPSHDKTAPEILDHYPQGGATIGPGERLWAVIRDDQTGVGIDFSRTGLRVDGHEVEATWDPVNNRISCLPVDLLTDGPHLFSIRATDFNGNETLLGVSFNVYGTGVDPVERPLERTIRCYPNPFSDYLSVELGPGGEVTAEVAVYDLAGSRVATLFSGQLPAAGQKLTWNRVTNGGRLAPAGTYFIWVREGAQIRVNKVIINGIN
ncbi:MAG: VWA domain-containing protein [Bacteroidales bacterium]